MNAIQKILVPTDFSAHSDEAFRMALVLARAIGAEVVVFHIAQPPVVAAECGPLLARPTDSGSANVWDHFHRLQSPDPAVRVEHLTIVVEKPSAAHILETLDKMGCDLIVMGTHGRSWLKHRLLGSVTEEVVRLAHCPVMVVKAPAHKADAPTPRAAAKAEGPPHKP